MPSMETLADTFVQKCKDFAVEPVAPLVEELQHGQELTAISLNGNSKRLFSKRVQPAQVFALAETLHEVTSITSVDLSYNSLDDFAAQALAGLLKVNTTIQSLDLTGNSLTGAGAAMLAEALAKPTCGLATLLLGGNPLGDKGLDALAEALRTNRSLQVLQLGNTHCGLQGLVKLCVVLSEPHGPLKVLDLESPMIREPQDSSILHLCRMLASDSTLQELCLAKHALVDSSLDTLVTYGLLKNSSLTTLDFRANKLSPFAAPTLERLLGGCPALRVLRLSFNRLGDEGAAALARCLPYTHWLEELDVRSNNIGEQGLLALAEALPLAAHLKVFLLWGNTPGPGASRALADALSQPSLKELVTDVLPYTVDGITQLALAE